jgi:hypothetical protein
MPERWVRLPPPPGSATCGAEIVDAIRRRVTREPQAGDGSTLTALPLAECSF